MNIFFQNHQITIYRHRRIGSTNRYGMSATFTVYPADIQPASRERVEMVEGRYGAVFTGFVDTNSDIKEGDQIVTVSDGKKYSVKGVQRWDGAGLLDHLELLLVARDGNG